MTKIPYPRRLFFSSHSGSKLMGPSEKPLKYSSSETRWFGLHGLQAGQEFNEEYQAMPADPGCVATNFGALNIKSGANVTDCPSRFGETKYGLRKIGGLVFTPENDYSGWIRNKGEPT